jgi:hypothetical protein
MKMGLRNFQLRKWLGVISTVDFVTRSFKSPRFANSITDSYKFCNISGQEAILV